MAGKIIVRIFDTPQRPQFFLLNKYNGKWINNIRGVSELQLAARANAQATSFRNFKGPDV